MLHALDNSADKSVINYLRLEATNIIIAWGIHELSELSSWIMDSGKLAGGVQQLALTEPTVHSFNGLMIQLCTYILEVA